MLEAAGWRVHLIWECELRTPGRVASLIEEIKGPAAGRSVSMDSMC